ncbi:hypothetical protein LZ31DRAFT_327737 [Colletotrichum somersetense]|nr:hypothetical protein LZ31DRAFT_327737 [Colletotrichum somersetense]
MPLVAILLLVDRRSSPLPRTSAHAREATKNARRIMPPPTRQPLIARSGQRTADEKPSLLWSSQGSSAPSPMRLFPKANPGLATFKRGQISQWRVAPNDQQLLPGRENKNTNKGQAMQPS